MNEVVLDVRPIIAAGEEPFGQIMATVSALKKGEALHLINSFEPGPLYRVLGSRGFTHRTEEQEGVWHIYFSKGDGEAAAKGEGEEAIDTCGGCGSTEPEVIELDVRELEPPEPMIRILEALPRIGERGLLVVHHHREPLLLYEKLTQRGYTAKTIKINKGYYKVIITQETSGA
ncbi:MAG: DUF2249 domain-containing protein [Candidatus Latescibacteria bacterium]|nr:DUF2249 domain-containing protein [Candidatus Latescibacterota bacterium]